MSLSSTRKDECFFISLLKLKKQMLDAAFSSKISKVPTTLTFGELMLCLPKVKKRAKKLLRTVLSRPGGKKLKEEIHISPSSRARVGPRKLHSSGRISHLRQSSKKHRPAKPQSCITMCKRIQRSSDSHEGGTCILQHLT